MSSAWPHLHVLLAGVLRQVVHAHGLQHVLRGVEEDALIILQGVDGLEVLLPDLPQQCG